MSLISPAYAQAGGAPQGSGIFELVMIVVMVAVFYFLLIRPQQKRAKEHQRLVSELAKGDEVITAGGILGRITKVDENYAVVEIADNMEIKLQKHSIQSTLPKGTLKSI